MRSRPNFPTTAVPTIKSVAAISCLAVAAAGCVADGEAALVADELEPIETSAAESALDEDEATQELGQHGARAVNIDMQPSGAFRFLGFDGRVVLAPTDDGVEARIAATGGLPGKYNVFVREGTCDEPGNYVTLTKQHTKADEPAEADEPKGGYGFGYGDPYGGDLFGDLGYGMGGYGYGYSPDYGYGHGGYDSGYPGYGYGYGHGQPGYRYRHGRSGRSYRYGYPGYRHGYGYGYSDPGYGYGYRRGYKRSWRSGYGRAYGWLQHQGYMGELDIQKDQRGTLTRTLEAMNPRDLEEKIIVLEAGPDQVVACAPVEKGAFQY